MSLRQLERRLSSKGINYCIHGVKHITLKIKCSDETYELVTQWIQLINQKITLCRF